MICTTCRGPAGLTTCPRCGPRELVPIAGGAGRPLLIRSYVARQAATVVGALLVLGAAGLPWVTSAKQSRSPFHLSPRWLWAGQSGFNADPVKSIGILLLVAAGVIVLGLTTSGRWVTAIGGLAAFVAGALFLFQLVAGATPKLTISSAGIGLWLALAGGVLAVITAFLGPARRRR